MFWLRNKKLNFRYTLLTKVLFECITFQTRLPSDVSDDVDEDPTGNKALWDRGCLNGASQKVSFRNCLQIKNF